MSDFAMNVFLISVAVMYFAVTVLIGVVVYDMLKNK